MNNSPIHVTRPSLPPLKNYNKILQEVWKSGILTHHGPKVQQLEKELLKVLHLKHMTVVTNGTIALQLAIRALNLKGEIITTPFTWVATVSAIRWEGCQPVLADVDPSTFNIDPQEIEKRITKKTSAILAVHTLSNPCDLKGIQKIADKYKLKVIYDAAHAMFVNVNKRSILEYGDISATSFHATKIFQTGEGGACVTTDAKLAERLQRLRFFGYDDTKNIVDDGMNGKTTEVHAALGLTLLPLMKKVLADRKEKYMFYMEKLKKSPYITFQKFDPDSYNFSYLPILLTDERMLLRCTAALNKQNIFPRRYFYPSLNTVKLFKTRHKFPVAEDLASRILCLPLYYDLSRKDIEKVCAVILKV